MTQTLSNIYTSFYITGSPLVPDACGGGRADALLGVSEDIKKGRATEGRDKGTKSVD